MWAPEGRPNSRWPSKAPARHIWEKHTLSSSSRRAGGGGGAVGGGFGDQPVAEGAHLGALERARRADDVVGAVDIDGEADLVEEVLRVHGYDAIPSVAASRENAVPKPVRDAAQRRAEAARRMLAARGLVEAVTYSFMEEKQAALFGGIVESVRLVNPISADLDVMRPSILPNLVAAVARNQAVTWLRRRNAQARIGRGFAAESAEIYTATPATRASSREQLRLLHAGMDQLGADDRLILDLYFTQDLKYAEIAELLGMNINTVAGKLRRARAKLRRLLERDLG